VFEGSRPVLIRYLEFGPNAGYAYTLVLRKHFFLTGSGSISMDYGQTTFRSEQGERIVSGFTPNIFLRFFGGYNSAYWAVSLIYVNNAVTLPGTSQTRMQLNTGNFRLNLVRRFRPSKKARELLKVVDEAKKTE